MFAVVLRGRGGSALLLGLLLLAATPLGAVDPLPVPSPIPEDSFRKPQFIRGDTNGDGVVGIADTVFELFHLFVGTVEMECLAAGDTNADRQLDSSDAVYGLEFLFLGKDAPPAPGPYACGVDPADPWLECERYDGCGDDLLVITHVLNRITFGPTVDLMSRIQTRDDLVQYIEGQLSPPADYDPLTDEPEIAAAIDALDIGFREDYQTVNGQSDRLDAMLILNGAKSEWQLLHVLTEFWNNHFHTQLETLRSNFFQRGVRGGVDGRNRASRAMFNAVDTDADDIISESEWNVFRVAHPAVIPYSLFGNRRDGGVDLDEFLDRRNVAYWKYGRGRDQRGVAADMERREYEVLRRRALGSFRDLLEASAKGVAMIIYLNTYENTNLAPNENYGREFFELSSLGVDWVYTQRDIEEVSEVFTGWTVDWVRRSDFEASDDNFQNNPGARAFTLSGRESGTFDFPATTRWSDDVYTWAFIFGHREGQVANQGGGHDWGAKRLFLRRYGGTDSLGNPPSAAAALTIPNNPDDRTTERALEEFDLVLDRVVSFRDCAKFISTKLIQKFVTDDLNTLAKTRQLSSEMRSAFESVDLNGDGNLDRAEWSEPIPLVLPDGRPPDKFQALDINGDGLVSGTEYQEPDLLVDAIVTWQQTDGDMREVLRTILLSDEFLSLKHYRSKIKTPLEVVTSTIRILDADPRENQLLRATGDITLAGMELFDFGDPTGESEFGFDWMHTIGLLERLRFINLGANPPSNNQSRFDWDPTGFMQRYGLSTAERTVDFANLLIHGGDILANHRELALEAYRTAPFADRFRVTAGFLLSLPQFQKQ